MKKYLLLTTAAILGSVMASGAWAVTTCSSSQTSATLRLSNDVGASQALMGIPSHHILLSSHQQDSQTTQVCFSKPLGEQKIRLEVLGTTQCFLTQANKGKVFVAVVDQMTAAVSVYQGWSALAGQQLSQSSCT